MHKALPRFALIAGLLFGGMAYGVALAWLLAPGSGLARVIGLLMLPLSLGAGIAMWYAVAFATVWKLLSRVLLQSARGGDLERDLTERITALAGRPIPGTYVFVPVALAVSFACGLIVALTPAALDFAVVLGAFTANGLVFGLLLRHLARAGRLPVPGEP